VRQLALIFQYLAAYPILIKFSLLTMFQLLAANLIHVQHPVAVGLADQLKFEVRQIEPHILQSRAKTNTDFRTQFALFVGILISERLLSISEKASVKISRQLNGLLTT
jgi:hypothetical protein